MPAAARDLVQSGVDIIFAVSGYAAQATQQATSQIPIVSAFTGANPVTLGLVESFVLPRSLVARASSPWSIRGRMPLPRGEQGQANGSVTSPIFS